MFTLFLFNFTLMSATDVISVADVNSWLSLDLDTEDTQAIKEVERLIRSAVAWVENYTSHRLYERQEVIANSKCDQTIALYPITVNSVTYQSAEAATYTKYVLPTKLRIRCPWNSIITLTVGYASAADIPGPLIDACFKLITYMYEDRDIYQAGMPTDVQMLINQYRRAII